LSFGVRGAVSNVSGYGFGCGFGGVDDGERVVEGGEGSADGWLEKRIVRAAEEKGLGVWSFGQGLLEGDFEDFVGDWVIDPAFFYQRDQQGAGFFVGL
jgi:hypothetical protein